MYREHSSRCQESLRSHCVVRLLVGSRLMQPCQQWFMLRRKEVLRSANILKRLLLLTNRLFGSRKKKFVNHAATSIHFRGKKSAKQSTKVPFWMNSAICCGAPTCPIPCLQSHLNILLFLQAGCSTMSLAQSEDISSYHLSGEWKTLQSHSFD